MPYKLYRVKKIASEIVQIPRHECRIQTTKTQSQPTSNNSEVGQQEAGRQEVGRQEAGRQEVGRQEIGRRKCRNFQSQFYFKLSIYALQLFNYTILICQCNIVKC